MEKVDWRGVLNVFIGQFCMYQAYQYYQAYQQLTADGSESAYLLWTLVFGILGLGAVILGFVQIIRCYRSGGESAQKADATATDSADAPEA